MSDIYLHYKGKHKGFLVGIPARDLTYAETIKNGGADFLVGTGSYEYVRENSVIEVKEYKPKKHSIKKESEE